MRMRSAIVAALLALPVAFGAARSAHAADPTTADCLGASESAYKLRAAHRLREMREQLLTCAASTCPSDVHAECERRLKEVNVAMPTLVFEVKDGAGNDLTAVTVTMDGKPLVARLEGTAVSLDPGQHSFHFEAPGLPPTDKTIVLLEGQKDRRERVVLGAPASAATPQPPAPEPSTHLATLAVAADAAATVSIDGKVVGTGAYRDQLPSGTHVVTVTQDGKTPHRVEVDLRDGETRTLDVTLQDERHAAIWPWVAGGGVVAIAAVVGGYFLFKPSDTTTPVPTGTNGGGSVHFSGFRR